MLWRSLCFQKARSQFLWPGKNHRIFWAGQVASREAILIFEKITSLRPAPLGSANLFAVLMLPELRPALFWPGE